MKINFKDEILSSLNQHHFKPEDVDFVRGTSLSDSWVYESIEKCLHDADFEYDNEDGIDDIDVSLVIVMKDKSYFTRESTNGKEYFSYHCAPQKPTIDGVICLAPILLMKKNKEIQQCKKQLEELENRIAELKNTNYTFMEY